MLISRSSGMSRAPTAACCILLLVLAGSAAFAELDPRSSVASVSADTVPEAGPDVQLPAESWHLPVVAPAAAAAAAATSGSSRSNRNNGGSGSGSSSVLPQSLQQLLRLGADDAVFGAEDSFSNGDNGLLAVIQASAMDGDFGLVPGTNEAARALLGMSAPLNPKSKCIQYAKQVNNRAREGQKLLVINSPLLERCPKNCRAGIKRQVADGVYNVTCNVNNCKCMFVSADNKKHSGIRINDNAGLLTQKVAKQCAVKACTGVYAFCKQC